MADWDAALREWNDFLRAVDQARLELRCSRSSAWFRGQGDQRWDLLPSLLRSDIPDRLSNDQARVHSQTSAELLERRRLLKEAKTRSAELRRTISSQHSDGEVVAGRIAEERHAELSSRHRTLRREIKAREHRLRVIEATHYGERDAFVDFTFRSTHRSDSSWESLAEMQHYRVPTRLLDWTEVLALAVFFAVEEYDERLVDHWARNATSADEFPLVVPDDLSTPAVWILSPYKLARSAIGENSIPDLSLEVDLDYFHRFFVSSDWPFAKPVPSYSPWRNPRLAAQQGMFTVHGLNRAPLDRQVSDCTKKVPISPLAAVYAARHLRTFVGLDKFIMYRDRDNLGKRVKERFLTPKELAPAEAHPSTDSH